MLASPNGEGFVHVTSRMHQPFHLFDGIDLRDFKSRDNIRIFYINKCQSDFIYI